MKIKTGIRAAGVQGPGAEFSQRALRAARGKVREPKARSAAQAVALNEADRRSQSKGQKANRSAPPAVAGGQQQRRRRFRVVLGWRAAAAARPISVEPAAGGGYGRGVVEDALRRHLLELQPTPVSVMQWVITGRWPDPDLRVDVAFVPHGTTPLL